MAAAKAVEVMVEAMAKAVEIVLLNRIMHPFDLSRSPGRTRFNVEVDEVDVVRGLIEYWRRDPGLPLVLLVVTRSPSGGPAALLERWELRYAAARGGGGGGGGEAEALASVRALWRRLVVLLRTVYSIAASLPCARLARRAEVDARRARGGAGTAALGFAVATREVGGGGWLVLDGSGAPAYDSAPPLRFEGGAEALALAPAACCFGALSATVHYARAPVASAPPPPPPRARTSDRAATARPGPPSGLSLLLARAPPNADAAAANVTGPSAAPRAAAAASSSSLDARALPGRLAPGRRRAAPPGPRSFDPANRATPGGASPGAPTGVCDAPFGLALAARHATAAEDARTRASPPAVASTPPFASRSPPAGGLERAPAPRGSSRTAPAAGSPPFAALAAAGRAAQPRAEPRRPRAPWVNRAAPGATTPPALGGNAAAGRPPRALARVSRAAPSSADDPWVARRGAVRIAAADLGDPGAPVPLAPLAHRAKVDHAADRRDRARDPPPFVLDMAADERARLPPPRARAAGDADGVSAVRRACAAWTDRKSVV